MDITVEEAALRLGLSAATVKRRLRNNQLAGRKIGRQWVVDDSKLPAPTRASGAGAAAVRNLDVRQAFRHLRSTDLNELWVPDVLRWADYLADSTDLLREAEVRATTGRCEAHTEVDVPKTPMLTRPAVILSLEDRIAYQAVISSLLPIIDRRLSDRVYSSRMTTLTEFMFKKSTKQWVAWHRSVSKEVKAGSPWVAKTDLTAYFESVDHAILLRELAAAGAAPHAVATLRAFLSVWSRAPGRGLPQGPNASRALGNFYMVAVDDVMLAENINYWRYMDDVMIVAPTKAEAVMGMRVLERECRKRGLILNAHKTQLLTGDDAVIAGSRPLLDDAQYLMDSRQERRARTLLRKILAESLGKDGEVDVGGTTFSLWRLARLVDRGPLRRILARLEDIGPVARVSSAYLRLFLALPEVEAGLSSYLADPTRNTSTVTESWMFACMVEHPGSLPIEWIDRARAVAQDRNGLAFHRGLAANVVALAKLPTDLAWIKSELRREYDPDMLRAYLVALARAGELDKNTASAAKNRTSSLGPTLDYLTNRRVLPSLVWRGQEVKVK